MKKWILLSSALMTSVVVFAANAGNMNQDAGCGIDCDLFLNPFIEKELSSVSGQMVLEAGSCLAPRAIQAAKNGASVCVLEEKGQLLERAEAAVHLAGVQSQISFTQTDVEKLPFASQTFDLALCINSTVGMAATTQLISQDQLEEKGLGAYFCEIARVMKEGGRLVIATPASYGVVFTNGSSPNEAAYEHIDKVLAQIGASTDPEVIIAQLSQLEEVTRAAFVFKNDRLQLVTNEKELLIGQPIWCKIPDGVIASVYHSEEEYLIAIERAGLKCEEIKRPCFFGKVKYDAWLRSSHVCNQSLGDAYIDNHPFTLFYVVKKA